MKMKKELTRTLLYVFILTIFAVFINAEYLSDENLNMLENDIYNASNMNATAFFQDGNAVLDNTSTVSSANSSTFWANMSSFQTRWFSNLLEVLTFNETLLNATIDARDTNTQWNITGSNYLINNSNVLDWDDTKGNNTYINTEEESSLDVNRSDFWDDLNTPADINASDITDDGTYVKVSGDNMTGNLNMSDNNISGIDTITATDYVGIQASEVGSGTFPGAVYNMGGFWLYTDSKGDTHVVQADGTSIDRLRKDVFLTPISVTYFSNSSGIFLNLSSTTDETIKVNINRTQKDTDEMEFIVLINNGTQANPVANYVYMHNISNPTISIAATEEEVEIINHVWVDRVLVGNFSGSNHEIYSSAHADDLVDESLHNNDDKDYHLGLLYEAGFSTTVNATALQVGAGEYWYKALEKETFENHTLIDGVFLVNASGNYEIINDLSDITTYGDTGNLIGNSKYVNLVWCIVSSNGIVRLMVLVQNEPSTEYNSISVALADIENKVVFSPSVKLLKLTFLPFAQTVFQQGTNQFEIVSGSDRFLDLRGTKDATAGGSAPSPSIVDHNLLTASSLIFTASGHTGELNLPINWTFNQNYPTGCAGNEFVRTINDTLTCAVDQNTEYTDGVGLNLSGTVFSLDVDFTNREYVNRTDWTTIDDYPAACNSTSFIRGLGDTSTCETDQNTEYTNSSPISLTGTIFGFSPCPNNQFYIYNTTSAAWECGSAGAGDITAVNTDGPYLTGGAVTGDVDLLLNDTKLNETIDARDQQGVTSVAAGNGLDFTTITSTGSVTLGLPGTLTGSTTNGLTATSHTHTITSDDSGDCAAGEICGGGHSHSDKVDVAGDTITGNLTISTASIIMDEDNKICMNTNCSMWICSNGSVMILSNGDSGLTC